ncbi:MAG: flagellar protein FlgN [Pelagimonas sp.]|jgi:hypothetical protein|nr:flagellar protein FlgN [Pelagimonas sp.]
MTDKEIKFRLETLIDEERNALIKGDFDRISELMEEKQALASDLERHRFSPNELAPLKRGMRRNQELFDQALAGIRNVAARLGDLSRARRSMDTYDSEGRKYTIEAPTDHRLEKRA